MATKKDTKKKKVTNPYDFFIKGRSRKAIEMDYSMKAKPPSSKEKRVNRTDYPGENLYYLEYFKKHNITPPKKATKKKTTTKKTDAKKTTTKKTTAKKTAAKKTTAKKTAAKKTASKKKLSEPQITEKEPQVGDIIKLKSGRIDKIIKVIPEDDWHFKRYMTQELNPPAGQEPKIGKLYYNDFEIIEQNPEKKIAEKTTQKKVKEPKKTTTKKEILDKLSPIRTYQSPLQSIHYNKNDIVIKVTDNPNCFAHPLMILLDRNKNEIDKWLEKYSNRREIQYETVIKTLKDNSKSKKLLPIKFIELIELDEEEKDTFAYLKTKYIAIVEIDNKKYVANPYLLKWLIKENYNIYAKKEILQDNFDTDYNSIPNFFVILKKNDEIKGLVSSLIYKDEDLTNIYREKTIH